MTRVFDAPRRLVFDAFTKPELVKKWLLGPPGWTMPVCEIDLRWEASIVMCGGVRVTEKKWDGRRLPRDRAARTARLYRVVRRGLVRRRVADHDHASSRAAGPRYEHHALRTQEVRDGVLKSGMESGVAASYDRLAECWRRSRDA